MFPLRDALPTATTTAFTAISRDQNHHMNSLQDHSHAQLVHQQDHQPQQQQQHVYQSNQMTINNGFDGLSSSSNNYLNSKSTGGGGGGASMHAPNVNNATANRSSSAAAASHNSTGHHGSHNIFQSSSTLSSDEIRYRRRKHPELVPVMPRERDIFPVGTKMTSSVSYRVTSPGQAKSASKLSGSNAGGDTTDSMMTTSMMSTSTTGIGIKKTPRRAVSMSRLDQLAQPKKHYIQARQHTKDNKGQANGALNNSDLKSSEKISNGISKAASANAAKPRTSRLEGTGFKSASTIPRDKPQPPEKPTSITKSASNSVSLRQQARGKRTPTSAPSTPIAPPSFGPNANTAKSPTTSTPKPSVPAKPQRLLNTMSASKKSLDSATPNAKTSTPKPANSNQKKVNSSTVKAKKPDNTPNV